MEQHPVPQNVTTFQFRLIGDMTLKQFGYLCAGAILAFIAYKLPLPFFFTWPLAFAFAFLGVGFAFIPIEERPMDVWVFSFFKSIYNPTQYVWTKSNQGTPSAPSPTKPTAPSPRVVSNPAQPPKPPATTPQKSPVSDLFQKQPAQAPAPATLRSAITQKTISKPPFSLVSWFKSFFSPAAGPVKATTAVKMPARPSPPPGPQQPVVFVPVNNVTGKKPEEPVPPVQPELKKDAAQSTDAGTNEKMKGLESTLKTLQSQLAEKDIASDRVLELQRQLTELLQQKSSMEEELVALRRQVGGSKEPKPPAPAVPQSPPTQQQKHAESAGRSTVTVINTQDQAVKVGLPKLTNVANVITGIVKDTEGNLLPNILVTVTNNDGVPVRALKTSKLGQFGASTPLGSGTYFVEIEDPRARFTFSRVQITLSGAVVPALEIIAKSQKQVTREKLTQEIFGNKGM